MGISAYPEYQAFIYPMDDPEDALVFWLYPDNTKIQRGTHISTSANPAGRDVVQVGGLKAVGQSHSVTFDDTLGLDTDETFFGAQFAEQWIETWLGRSAKQGGRNIFRVNVMSEFPMWCAIESQGSDVLYAPGGITRAVKWDLQLREVPPQALNPAILGSKKRKPRGKTRKESEAARKARDLKAQWRVNAVVQGEATKAMKPFSPAVRSIMADVFHGNLPVGYTPQSTNDMRGLRGTRF